MTKFVDVPYTYICNYIYDINVGTLQLHPYIHIYFGCMERPFGAIHKACDRPSENVDPLM